MNWDDEGYLISKNRYNENSIIADVFTNNHGKCPGIIFGATSKKIKNYLQIGNKIHVNYNFKSEGKLGYYKIEILKANTPFFFDDKKKLMCISTAMNLIKLLTADLQENKKIFFLLDNFFEILNHADWVRKYIFWELELLKLIGFHLELKDMVNEELLNDEKIYYVQSSTEKKIVPNFLIDHNENILDNQNLLKGLKLVGDYLDKTILKPNNINYPSSRLNFINMFK